MRRLALFALFVGLASMPRSALAGDDKAAAERFREGRRAFEAHDYQRAAAEFEAANKAKPAAAALLSAGLAWELGGDLVSAAVDLEAALAAGGLEARDEANARKHLAELDAKLGHLSVRGPAGHLTVDGHDTGSAPIEVRVSPGHHALELEPAEGQTVRRFADVTSGATVAVDMAPAPETPPPPKTSPGPPLQRTLGWIGLGVGAGVFVAGAIVGGVGLSTRDQFVSGGSTSTSLHDEAISLRTAANVLWVSAGVFAVAGAILFFTAPGTRAISVGLGPASASLKVVF